MRWARYSGCFRLQQAIYIVITLSIITSGLPRLASASTSCEVSAPCRKLLLQGTQLAAAGQHQQALDALNRALRMTDGQDARLLKEIGRSLQLLDRFEEAVDAYRRYLQAVPQDSPGRAVVLHWLRESLTAADTNQSDEAQQTAPGAAQLAAPTSSSSPAPVFRSDDEKISLKLVDTPPPSPIVATESLLSTDMTRCRAQRAAFSKRMKVGGAAIGAVGAAALLAASVMAGVHGTRTPGCMFDGVPVTCVRNTLSASIPWFVISGLGLGSGAALLSLSYSPLRSSAEAVCLAKRE